MDNKKLVEGLEKEIEILMKKKHDRLMGAPDGMSFSEFESYMDTPDQRRLEDLDRKLRLIQPPEFEEIINESGSRMSLKTFIGYVESGGFIDYDGSGEYVKDNMRTGIGIHPSDVKYNSIRKDFDEIIWFNR